MNDSQIIGPLVEAVVFDTDNSLRDLGVRVGKHYTDNGFPIDMSLERLDIGNDEKLAVLNGALWWLVQHKRNSGATEKALERQRKANREITARFLATGETGVY